MQTVQSSASPSRRVRAFEAKEVYLDWEDIAVQMVAILRAAAIAGVRNDRLTALVGELSVASPVFARSWADYRLFEHTRGAKRSSTRHVGEVRLRSPEPLPLPGHRGETVFVSRPTRVRHRWGKLYLLVLSAALNRIVGSAPGLSIASALEGAKPQVTQQI